MAERYDHIPVFDADNHRYEPIEALTQYLPAKHRGKVQLVQVGKRTRISLRGEISDYIPNPTFEVVAKPGSHADYYAGKNPLGLTLREMGGDLIRLVDSMRWPEPRLALMDEQRIEGAVIFPTLANPVEFHVADDPDLTPCCTRSTNGCTRCGRSIAVDAPSSPPPSPWPSSTTPSPSWNSCSNEGPRRS